MISIHAPLTGSDWSRRKAPLRGKNFNPRSPYGERQGCVHILGVAAGISIHAPLTGSDVLPLSVERSVTLFQSTLPLRGATTRQHMHLTNRSISIHAPLTGSDSWVSKHRTREHNFNPRSPYGERPCPATAWARVPGFQSTLPLRGATFTYCFLAAISTDFNPRSPYGERHGFVAGWIIPQ